MKSGVLRLSAAALLGGAALFTLVRHATHYISSSAMVNAPLLTVRAPFDGKVAAASPGTAAPVEAGDGIVAVAADRAERGDYDALAARLAVARAETRALRRRIAATEAAKAEMEDRVARHARALRRWLTAARREAEAIARQTAAQRARADRRLARTRRLMDGGRLPEAELEAARAEAESLAAQADRDAARRALLEARAAALADGVPLSGTDDGGLDARRRLDALALSLAKLRAELQVREARQAALRERVETAREVWRRRKRFAPRAASGAVVWRASPAAGAAVSGGETVLELLDCQNRFVEVAVSERHFGSIRPGDPASIQLKGDPRGFEARVEAVGGAGAWADPRALAARQPSTVEGQLKILVRLAPADVSRPGVAETFCDVGRNAQVRFDRDATAPLRWLGALARRLTENLGALAASGAPGPAPDRADRPS